MANSIRFEYAVYMLPVHSKDPSLVLSRLLAKKYPALKLVDQIQESFHGAVVSSRTQKNVEHDYAPPDERALSYFGRGISQEQARAIQKSKEAFILDFAHPKDNAWNALRAANDLVEEIARETGGLVWDEETREVFSPDAWHERRLASWTEGVPNIASQTIIHVYQKDEFARAITLGMTKAGFPDVVVDGFTWSSQNQVGGLINIFCQAMVEGRPIEKPERFILDLRSIENRKVRDGELNSLKGNATGVGYLSLKNGIWEDGDPKNRLIQLTFDRYEGKDIHARQARMLDCFFGWEDTVTGVKHNEELLEESRRARAKLPELHRAFDAGLQPDEFLQVKAPFKTPGGGNEWMWVEVTSWNGGDIKGILNSEPSSVPELHNGQIVQVREEDVFDYIHQYPDKHTEGNTTAKVLEKMEHFNPGIGAKVASQAENPGCIPN